MVLTVLTACTRSDGHGSSERAATSSTTTSTSTVTARGKAHIATPAETQELKAAFLRTHGQYGAADVRTRGDFYVATDDEGTQWAAGVFLVPQFEGQDQPEILKQPAGARWEDVGDTGGLVCGIPGSVAAEWHLPPVSNTSAGDCWEWAPSL